MKSHWQLVDLMIPFSTEKIRKTTRLLNENVLYAYEFTNEIKSPTIIQLSIDSVKSILSTLEQKTKDNLTLEAICQM